jgi:hypothetical protein
MKQKKSNTILIAILSIGVLSVLFANTTELWSGLAKTLFEKKEEKKEEAPTEAMKATDDAKAAAKAMLAKSSEKTKGGDPNEMKSDADAGTIPDKPTIEVPQPMRFKQNYNPSATSAQWYSEDHNTKNKEAELKNQIGE